MYHERIRYDVKRSIGNDGKGSGWLTVDRISEIDGQIFCNGTMSFSDPIELGMSHGATYARLYASHAVELRYVGEYKKFGILPAEKLMKPEDDDYFREFKEGFISGFEIGVKMRKSTS